MFSSLQYQPERLCPMTSVDQKIESLPIPCYSSKNLHNSQVRIA